MRAINVSREIDGLTEFSVAALVDVHPPTALPVQVELRTPDGGESMYLHCSAVVTRWPEQLRAMWTLRSAELYLPATARPDGHGKGRAGEGAPQAGGHTDHNIDQSEEAGAILS
jgi:hypothetical protein